MEVIDIYINRRGINTIEVPRQVEVAAGSTLILRFINMGHPTHVSISATNSQLYTPFIQENLYVGDMMEFEIPIRDGPYAGVFDLEVVTGYGTKKTTFKVFVTKKCEPPLQQTPAMVEESPFRFTFSFPVVLTVLGVLVYLVWLFARMDSLFLNDLLNVLGFLLVLGGSLLAWYSHRSS